MANHSPTPRSARSWLLRLVLPLVILGLAIAVFMALKASRPEPPRAAPEERAWLIETQVVEPVRRHPVLTLYGEVTNPDRLTVRAPLSARVESVPVEDGTNVDKGTLLVALDPRDFQPVLDRARANLADLDAQIRQERASHETDQNALALEREIVANAQTALKRNQDLRKRNLGSQADVDAARDTLSQARLSLNTRRERLATFDARLAGLEARRNAAAADVAAAERDVDRARVEAPADGLVGPVEVTVGALVNSNAALLDFFPRDGFELRALIPAARVDTLAGSLASGSPPSAHSREGNRTLHLDRLAGEASGEGVTGLFEFDQPDTTLRVGQVLTIELELPAVDNAIAIPRSALYGNDHLYRIRDGRLKRVRVERLGAAGAGTPEADGKLLVRAEALSAGDRIATTQLPNAVDGLKVRWQDGAGKAAVE
ncbi:biotin/lipoyl-binding protein [Guyparkeria hydrothermalis]|uniref:efflux RND transporter periplasmic adaptor subunit n=1 Tax=Guyparkeria hydrothermalis TaxID=923 RepID=UPI002021FAC3|nr:biotin/lipoyl-binding protein [Guyparkeria hydrothermalis]MCL7743996.1 biotin/lipoyl-binding protein [Guyparkeria hydrothermalis]